MLLLIPRSRLWKESSSFWASGRGLLVIMTTLHSKERKLGRLNFQREITTRFILFAPMSRRIGIKGLSLAAMDINKRPFWRLNVRFSTAPAIRKKKETLEDARYALHAYKTALHYAEAA